jgi:hypothetical protein
MKCSICFASIFLRGTLEVHTSFSRDTVYRDVQCHDTFFPTLLQYSILHSNWPLISKFPKSQNHFTWQSNIMSQLQNITSQNPSCLIKPITNIGRQKCMHVHMHAWVCKCACVYTRLKASSIKTALSVKWLVMGWMTGSVSDRSKDFALQHHVQDWQQGPISSCPMGTKGSFTMCKPGGASSWHSLPPNVNVKNMWNIASTLPYICMVWCLSKGKILCVYICAHTRFKPITDLSSI